MSMKLKSDGTQTISSWPSCRCDKCKGLLVKDYIYTYDERLFEIRCINCGKRTYIGILNSHKNRLDKQKNKGINRITKYSRHDTVIIS